MYKSFNVHTFSTLEDAKFSAKEYSHLKFGSDAAAKKIGYKLAVEFFNSHTDLLLTNKCVVFASPYNYVKNAATLMTEHFIDKLNHLLVETSGKHVEYSVVHRKVSYTADYGFLSKEKRRGLINNDEFYLNKDFIKGKFLIFLDDVKITGTHEERLIEELQKNNIDNDAMFLYYAQYNGNAPDIEGQLNFHAIKSIADLLQISLEKNYKAIIRPIKYILSHTELVNHITNIDDDFLNQIYYGALAEGYYKIPTYQVNFSLISKEKQRRTI